MTAPRGKNVVNLDDPRSILLPTTCAGQDERASSPGFAFPNGRVPWRYSAFNVTALPGHPGWEVSMSINHHRLQSLVTQHSSASTSSTWLARPPMLPFQKAHFCCTFLQCMGGLRPSNRNIKPADAATASVRIRTTWRPGMNRGHD
jgi:hypothetical protein